MKPTWFYYSDTNASAQGIEAVLTEKNEMFRNIHQLEGLLQELKKTNHAILFLKTNTIYNVYELCQRISVKFPHVYIILVVPDNMENMKKAMLAGASNILRHSAEPEEISEVITQANKYMRHRESKDGSVGFFLPKENSKVISICSAKGGSGRTSLAVSLASAFAKQKKKVAIIDANLQFGDVAVYFDLKPKQTIYEWVKEGYGSKTTSIEQYMVNHSSGIAVLAAPLRPEFFEIIAEEHIAAAIADMKKLYDVVIIDTPSYVNEIMLKCLAESNEILYLTTRDIPALRSSRLFLDMLETLKLKDKVRIVVNQDNKKKVIDPKRVEEILSLPASAVLPDQESIVSSSINEGVPFFLRNSKTPLAKEVLSLAKLLAPIDEEKDGSQKKMKKKLLVQK